MEKRLTRKVFMTMMLIVGFVLIDINVVRAENVVVVDNSGSGSSTAEYTFTIPEAVSNSEVIFTATIDKATGATVNIYKDGALFKSEQNTTSSSGWIYYKIGGGQHSWTIPLAAGTYSVSFTFDEDVNYTVVVSHENVAEEVYDDYTPEPVPSYESEPYLSYSYVTITAGSTQKLKVYNGKAKSWKSNKKSVATVSSKGKIKAKKPGKATITATLKNGKKLKCKVVVKKNKWVQKKKTWSDAPGYNLYIYPYNVEYNKNGDLVIKALALNNTSRTVRRIEGINIRMTTYGGSKIGTSRIGVQQYKLGPYKKGTITFTIKKSKLKKKNADLRNAWLYFSWVGYYYDLY